MSYEPGKMGVAEGMALVFTTTFTPIFLSSPAVYIDQAATAVWLIPLIAGLGGIAMIMVLLFLMRYVPGDLYEVSEQLIGRTGARLIAVYLIAAFFIDTVLTLRQFAENTLLTAIPALDITIAIGWYALMAATVILVGIEPIARATYLILPFGLPGIVFLLFFLHDKFDLYNLSPWFGAGLFPVFKTGIAASGLGIGVFILPVLAPAFQNLKTIRTAAFLGFGLSAVSRTVILFVYTGIFSVAVGREKVLPFFEMTRLIYVNRFIQRVESFFIVLWVIFGIATIAISFYIALYLLTRLFKLASMRPLTLPLAIVATQLALLPSDGATVLELSMLTNNGLTAGLFAIPMLLLVAARVKGRTTANHGS
ncbi:MAG: GerAB/ArcD/ProY family transporter [Negativicutes bacterium]|nr:GerAB/ArcD/ProY family transporter [Negativicutes bacterium]